MFFPLSFFLLFLKESTENVVSKEANCCLTSNKYLYENIPFDSNCYLIYNDLSCNVFDAQYYYSKHLHEKMFNAVSISAMINNTITKGKLLIGREAEIKELWFFKNLIYNIENEAFDDFTILETLHISNSPITTVNEKIFTEKLGAHLNALELKNLTLTNLSPNAFQYLTKLQRLNLVGNNIIAKIINDNFFGKHFSNLVSLNLDECNITKLNENVFTNLTNLKYLGLGSNHFTSIPSAINIIKTLHSLSVYNNDITEIFNDKKVLNENLKDLFIENSKKLTDIFDCGFCNFPNLQMIYLSYSSNLKYIHQNAFGNVKNSTASKITTFEAKQCNISSFSKLFLNWTILDSFSIDDNPINCDCSMAWINEIQEFNDPFKYKIKPILDETICYSPEKFRGQKWKNGFQKNCGNNFENLIIVNGKIVVAFGFLFLFFFTFITVLFLQKYKSDVKKMLKKVIKK